MHRLFELHQRHPNPLDLVVGQGALLHPPYRLALENLADEVDERQHQLHHRLPDVFRIGVPPRRRRPPLELLFQLARHHFERANLVFAAHGVSTIVQSGRMTTSMQRFPARPGQSTLTEAARSNFVDNRRGLNLLGGQFVESLLRW